VSEIFTPVREMSWISVKIKELSRNESCKKNCLKNFRNLCQWAFKYHSLMLFFAECCVLISYFNVYICVIFWLVVRLGYPT